jgi:hypothetical protein
VNRDNHELAADTGTLQQAPARPGAGSRSRAATPVTFSPAARSASAGKITGAAYFWPRRQPGRRAHRLGY